MSTLLDWAACRGTDPELFFEQDGESDLSRLRRVTAAISLCEACPVRQPCAELVDQIEGALPADRWFGIWGGETAWQRAQRRKRAHRQAS